MTTSDMRSQSTEVDSVEEPIKPWRLPFWTEDPVHRSSLLETGDSAAEPTDPNLADGEELADDEVELQYPTAEELETIRREAYNEGLEQGLVEGRQKGQKAGYDQGYQTGHQEGLAKGEQEGRDQGFHAGQSEGYRTGEEQIQQEIGRCQGLYHQLMATVIERDQQLPEVMTNLLITMTEQVLQAELKTGASAIYKFIEQSLESLPSRESMTDIYVAQQDYELLQQQGSKMTMAMPPDWLQAVSVDAGLTAGQCRVQSQHSLVEYSLSDAMQQQLLHYAEQCLHQSLDYPTTEEITPDLSPPLSQDSSPESSPESSQTSASEPVIADPQSAAVENAVATTIDELAVDPASAESDTGEAVDTLAVDDLVSDDLVNTKTTESATVSAGSEGTTQSDNPPELSNDEQLNDSLAGVEASSELSTDPAPETVSETAQASESNHPQETDGATPDEPE